MTAVPLHSFEKAVQSLYKRVSSIYPLISYILTVFLNSGDIMMTMALKVKKFSLFKFLRTI